MRNCLVGLTTPVSVGIPRSGTFRVRYKIIQGRFCNVLTSFCTNRLLTYQEKFVSTLQINTVTYLKYDFVTYQSESEVGYLYKTEYNGKKREVGKIDVLDNRVTDY